MARTKAFVARLIVLLEKPLPVWMWQQQSYGIALQAAAYYLGMLAYYWVLATPAVGFLFGCYLYIAVNWFHVHYDEAFSALRIPNFKGFSRLHINTKGDLEIYGLAMDKVEAHATAAMLEQLVTV